MDLKLGGRIVTTHLNEDEIATAVEWWMRKEFGLGFDADVVATLLVNGNGIAQADVRIRDHNKISEE